MQQQIKNQTPSNRVGLSVRVALRAALFSCVLIIIWFFGASEAMSFKKFVLLIGPYIVAWVAVSILSVVVSGVIFKPFWMGSFSDSEVYTFPNIIYVFIFVGLIFGIYIVQYVKGVI